VADVYLRRAGDLKIEKVASGRDNGVTKLRALKRKKEKQAGYNMGQNRVEKKKAGVHFAATLGTKRTHKKHKLLWGWGTLRQIS